MTLCQTCDSLPMGDCDESNLGEYNELVSRAEAGCEGCRFFTTILQSSDGWKSRLDKLPGRVIVLDLLRLQAKDPTGLSRSTFTLDDLNFDICVPEGEEHEELDSVRVVPVNPLDERCLRQIRSWVSECAGHTNCTKPEPVSLPRAIIEIPSDAKEPPKVCLSEGKTGSYVVLSYCSDNTPPLPVSETTNFPISLDVQSLPKTVTDAIEVTRRLGYQYLWVDALCMTGHNWDKELSAFISIYNQAELMLSATNGEDANSGMLHDRHVLYSPGLGPDKNRYLRQELLRWESDLEKSPLEKRGWPFIERALAPRIIHFAKHQMLWECASGIQYEGSKHKNSIIGSGQIRERYRKQIVQPYIDKTLSGHTEKDQDTNTGGGLARYETWHQCVDEFSGRELKRPTDKLPAMAPLASILDDGSMGTYLAGIWSNDIAAGLSWGRPFYLLTPSSTYRAPSWSWASVDGKVSSMVLAWPEDLMDGHSKDPAWINKYQPKLLSHNIILENPSHPYGRVLEGSSITLEGSCLGLMSLAKALGPRPEFYIIPVLDEAQAFDCPCCAGRSDEDQKAEMAKIEGEIEHHVCMILQGDAWRVEEDWSRGRGFCDLLILKALGDSTFKRVGSMRINSDKPEPAHAAFDALDWERRVLKLI
ncbi:HET domain protein [Aspergillus steynii IBT 23096]|uniref:HET domain protein n=1 Tax=Aspergillus steynii IBT 23096 TaxID=1392250 RepID=A0A2I2GKM3_9EURO|nr:HET domain protein [Aspergillus steynii IBT 23096]PLB53432.1 HET domain protein [Aspergillus steynii IBT 23096]